MTMDTASRLERSTLSVLLEGHQAGHFSLPDELKQALTAEERIRDELQAANAEVQRLGSSGEAIGDLAAAVLEAALAGEPLPDMATGVRAAEQAERAVQIRVQVLQQALESASWQALSLDAGEIVREHLRPAFEETIAEVKALSGKLAGRDLENAEQFVDAPGPVRAAYIRLRELHSRYQALRAAQRHLNRGTNDGAEDFAEVRNLVELYGDRWPGRYMSSWRPGPQDSLSRLLWLTTSEAQPWLPTREERDAAVVEMIAAAQPRRRTVGVGF
ncbi:hypothetical protein BH23CHL7_BH23CHL7_20870 [soil metagenome]